MHFLTIPLQKTLACEFDIVWPCVHKLSSDYFKIWPFDSVFLGYRLFFVTRYDIFPQEGKWFFLIKANLYVSICVLSFDFFFFEGGYHFSFGPAQKNDSAPWDEMLRYKLHESFSVKGLSI